MQQDRAVLQTVHTVVRLLATTVDIDEAIRRALTAAIEASDAEGGSILIHEPHSHLLRFRQVVGGKGEGLVGFAIPDDEGIVGRVYQTGQAITSNAAEADPLHSSQVDETFDFRTSSVVTVPIRYPGGRTLGVLQLVNKRDGGFGETELGIIASIAAMSIINADLAVQAQRAAADSSCEALAREVTERVTPMVARFQTLQFDESDLASHRQRLASDDRARNLADALSAVTNGAVEIQRHVEARADAAKKQRYSR